MKAELVIDCSITMSWCFGDEATPTSAEIQDRLVDAMAVVPSHWPLEVANVLTMAERRRRITAAKSAEFLSLLEALDIQVDHESPARAFTHVLPLCRDHTLTSYDAAYLELAMRTGLPIASLDDELRRAAKTLGIPTLGR